MKLILNESSVGDYVDVDVVGDDGERTFRDRIYFDDGGVSGAKTMALILAGEYEFEIEIS